MKSGIFISVLLAVLLCAGHGALAKSGEWKLVMDKDGIRAYARQAPGSNIQETRAVMTVDANLETVNAVMRDSPGYKDWFPYYKKSEVVEERSRHDLDVYMVLSLPWPVQERDMLMNCKSVYDLKAARGVVSLCAKDSPKFPPTPHAVRIKNYTGSNVFEFISKDKTGVIFTMKLDLAGRIPPAILNMLAKYNLYDTFVGLRRMVKKPRYIEAGKRSDEQNIVKGVVDSDASIREVFRTRLLEFIGDRTFVEKVVDDAALRERFFASQNSLAETLLYGWGSEKSKKEAVTKILLAYLPAHVSDPKAAQSLASDEELVDTILNGKGPFEKVLAARNCALK